MTAQRLDRLDHIRQYHRVSEAARRAKDPERHREHHRLYMRHYRLRELEAREARRMVKKALQAGSLVKGPCVVCGVEDTHGHHPRGYAPEHYLDVVWLCVTHHAKEHIRMRSARAVAA